jgi:hypothetical protein
MVVISIAATMPVKNPMGRTSVRRNVEMFSSRAGYMNKSTVRVIAADIKTLIIRPNANLLIAESSRLKS